MTVLSHSTCVCTRVLVVLMHWVSSIVVKKQANTAGHLVTLGKTDPLQNGAKRDHTSKNLEGGGGEWFLDPF